MVDATTIGIGPVLFKYNGASTRKNGIYHSRN
jgi:hypothetical protein